MADPDPHAWRSLIEPRAIDSSTGDPFSLTISQAISAKRQADALERIASAFDGQSMTPVSIPNAMGVRRGFELISAHIDYIERENARLNDLLTTYYMNALRGEAEALTAFIKNHGHDVHRDRKTLADAIGEFQAAREGDAQ
jgi:hypothetical protein